MGPEPPEAMAMTHLKVARVQHHAHTQLVHEGCARALLLIKRRPAE